MLPSVWSAKESMGDVREAGTKYCYTQKEIKITYDFGDLPPVILKPIPKKQSKTEMILTVPKGSLTQNK